MKFRTLIVSLLAAAALFCGCKRETESLGIPSIRFSQESLTFGTQGGDAFVVVTISRDWTAYTDAEWLGIERTSGKGSSKAQEIKISALPNAAEDAYNRSASINFVVGKKLITKSYTIYQDGAAGDAPIVGPYFEYNFKKEGQGGFVFEDVKKPDELSYVWVANSYGLVASGYKNPTNYETESWCISPEITVEGDGTNYVYFSHAGNYFNSSTMKDECTFWIADATPSKAGEQWKQLEIPTYFSNSGYTFVNSGDIDITEYKGKTVKFGFKYKSTTAKAGTWEIESLTLSTLKHDEAVPGGSDDPGPGPVGDDVIFYNNFDKEVATQEGTSWPFLDKFEGWKNQVGSGAGNVDYEFKGVSARNNSNTDGQYSDYAGSGKNNLFFGQEAHFQVRKIALGGATNLTLSFGSEKYLKTGSLFSKDEFKVYVSNTAEGASWVSLDYSFAKGAMPDGRWDLASTTFTVPSGTSTLYIYISASVASAYRIDDLKLVKASAAGTAVDFSKGVDLGTNGGGEDVSTDPGPGPSPEGVIFGNNFDKEVAAQTYGTNSNSWPYLDQFEGWKNETGSGAGNVEYEFKAMSARNNSNTDGQYSDYAGSGKNNLFFGSSAHFQVRKIALEGATSFSLSFGSEKYTQTDKVFSKDEFKVYVSDTAGGASWVSLDYSFAKGAMPEGRWDLATAYFTVPSGTQYLNIYISASVASAYRIDDLTLATAAASATSQAVNFSQGVDLGTTAIDGQGGDPSGDPSVDPGTSTDPTPGGATVIFEETFSDGPGIFYVEDVTLPEGLETVWTHDASYHNMKATGYTDKANDAESWLIMEEPLDLSNCSTAWLTFDHTGKFFANPSEEVAVCASTNMQEWSDLTIPNWFANTNWTFVSSGNVDLSDFAGESEVYLAFVYTSTANAGGTWEIKNLKVYADGGSGPTPPVDPSTDPSVDPGTSTDPSVDPGTSTDPVIGDGVLIDVSQLGLVDGATPPDFQAEGFTFKFDKNNGGTAPLYKNNPNSTFEPDIRVYAKGTVTVIGPPGSIFYKIVFNLSSKGLEQTATITASTGTVTTQKKGDTTVTWEGMTPKVIFTVGEKNDFGSSDKTSGQFCFKSVYIE